MPNEKNVEAELRNIQNHVMQMIPYANKNVDRACHHRNLNLNMETVLLIHVHFDVWPNEQNNYGVKKV